MEYEGTIKIQDFHGNLYQAYQYNDYLYWRADPKEDQASKFNIMFNQKIVNKGQ